MPEITVDAPERLTYVPPCPFKPQPGIAIGIPDVPQEMPGKIHIPRATWREAEGAHEEFAAQTKRPPYLPKEDWLLVIAVGPPGVNYESGVEVPWHIRPGDRVRIQSVAGMQLEGEQGYVFFTSTDVLCTDGVDPP